MYPQSLYRDIDIDVYTRRHLMEISSSFHNLYRYTKDLEWVKQVEEE